MARVPVIVTPKRARELVLTPTDQHGLFLLSGIAALVLGIAAALVDYVRVASAGLPLGWDESLHAAAGLVIAEDLRHHDFLAFIRDSNAQVFYPPAWAWFQSPTLLWTSVDDGVARVGSLIALVLLACATWALAAAIAPRRGWAAGVVASALLVASPMTLAMATQPMIEVFNGLIITAAVGAQVYYRNSGRQRWTTMASLLLLLNCLTKYNYAAFLVLAFVIDHVVEGDFARKRMFATFRWFYQPLAIGLAVWLAPDLGGKVGTAIGFGVSLAIDAHRTWWQECSYYASVLLDGGVRGPIGVTLLASGLVGAVLALRRPNLRLVWLTCVIAYVLLTVHPNKQARFLEPVVPVFIALAAAGLTSTVGSMGRRPLAAVTETAFSSSTSYHAVPSTLEVNQQYREGGVPSFSTASEILSYLWHVVPHVGDRTSPHTAGLKPSMNQAPRLGPSTQLFVLGVLGIISLVYTVVQLGTLPSPSRLDLSKRDAIHRVVSFIAQSVPPGKPAMLVGTFAEFGPYYVNWSLRGAWHVDSSAVVSDYASLAYPGPAPRGNIDPSPSPQYATIWSAWRGQHPNDWLVTIHMAQSSPFWTSEFGSANAWRQNYVTAIAESGERPVQTLDDASSGLLIRVYQPLPGK